MKTKVPSVVMHFFGNFRAPNVPEGYVYLGLCSSKTFKEFPWKTKSLGPLYSESENDNPRFQVFVSIKEVIEYILYSDSNKVCVSEDQRQSVIEYVQSSGLEIVKPLVKRKTPSVKVQKTSATQDESLDFYTKSLIETKQIFLKKRIELSSPSGKRKIFLDPGTYAFGLINSPREYETGQWLILEHKLPIIFGKSVTTWHQILGYNPLASK